jgi:hypothetical protein
MQPLLRGEQDSDRREGSDKNNGVGPERTLRGILSFDPGRRINPDGPGYGHELASPELEIVLIALSSIRHSIAAIPQKNQGKGR